jgi:DNA-binding NtrC family response regulator
MFVIAQCLLYNARMGDILFAWIGRTDLLASDGVEEAAVGPIGQAVATRMFSRVVLLSDWPESETAKYRRWLHDHSGAEVEVRKYPLPRGPMDFGAIYHAAQETVTNAVRDGSHRPVFHLSPGSPAMAAVWILLGKTLFDAELLESSKQHGVRVAEIPFDIAAEFAPVVLRKRDSALEKAIGSGPPESPDFANIVHRSTAMRQLIGMARRVGPRSVTVLIEGESGTGKELLARAIHRSSARTGQFVPVNCGAIPSELAESELFGHRRGAFTGATSDRIGHFEAASGGTIFLDEIGELPLQLQVKLLRVLQQREVTRVGETSSRPIDVRVIAATNRSLVSEVAEGRFREDLFYRLAVAVLEVPALRDRSGDLGLLVDHILDRINAEHRNEPNFPKELRVAARNTLLRHGWPGNVRELENTLRRAAIWSDESELSAEVVRASMLPSVVQHRSSDVLDQSLGSGFKLETLLGRVANHYLERALTTAGGNKSQAAELVGLASYQTFSNWMKRFGVRA